MCYDTHTVTEGRTCSCFVKRGSSKPLGKVVLHQVHMEAVLLGG